MCPVIRGSPLSPPYWTTFSVTRSQISVTDLISRLTSAVLIFSLKPTLTRTQAVPHGE